MELFREKQILFPARINCVTLTCSQIKPLAPQLKDADPPMPLLQAVGGMVSPTVVEDEGVAADSIPGQRFPAVCLSELVRAGTALPVEEQLLGDGRDPPQAGTRVLWG